MNSTGDFVRFGLGETGLGVGAGCGVGVGVGSSLNLSALPVVGQMAGGLLAGIDSVLGTFGQSTTGLRGGLKRLVPIKGIEGGLGCGVGIGYGFGVGLFVNTSAIQAHLPQNLPSFMTDRIPGLTPSTAAASTSGTAAPPSPPAQDSLSLSKSGVSTSVRGQMGISSDPAADEASLRRLAGKESLESMLTKVLLRHEDEIRILQDQNLVLRHQVDTLAAALCEVTEGKKNQPAFCKTSSGKKRGSGPAV